MVSADKSLIHLSTPRFAAGSCADVYVDVWRAPAGAADIRLTTEAQVAVARKLGAKVVALSVVLESGVGVPDSEARKALDAAMIQIAPHTKAAAVALLTTGFGGAIIRSLYVGVTLLARPVYPLRIASTIDEACAFLSPHVSSPGVDIADLVRLVRVAPSAAG